MNGDGKIYIIVTDKLPGGGEPGPKPKPSPKKPERETLSDTLMSHWAKSQLISEVKQLATTAVNYQLSNIGNFTGDYIQQTRVNDALRSLSGLTHIVSATVAGAKAGGPWGAVIGFSLGVINQTISSALEMNSRRIEVNKTNYEIAQLRQRVGLNTVLDGSRGTEN